jgi:hypothetical protein
LATTGATCFELLLSTCGEKFNEEQWTHVTQTIASILHKHVPLDFESNIALVPSSESDISPAVSNNPQSLSLSKSK